MATGSPFAPVELADGRRLIPSQCNNMCVVIFDLSSLLTVDCVLCTVLSCVLGTVYCVLCTVYCVLCTVYSILCIVY